jgi:hypothetical protein
MNHGKRYQQKEAVFGKDSLFFIIINQILFNN